MDSSVVLSAKDLVSSAQAQNGILITYPTPKDLAESTLTYATAKKRYVAELRSVMPIIIAIGLKQRPEDAEVKEFRSVFEQFSEEDEKRVDEATIRMLERFDYDKSVATAEKEFKKAQEIETSLLKEYSRLNTT